MSRPNRRTALTAIPSATRPLSSLVAGTLAASAAMAGPGFPALRAAAAGCAMTALAMFGFVVNDIFDYRKDRAAGVRRPVASGLLSRKGAAWLAAATLVIAGAASLLAGSGWPVLALTGLLLLLYSPLALRFPLCKDVYVAGLCAAPLYYGAVVGGRECAWHSYALLACFVLGREVMMDSDELPGDLQSGVRTLAAIAGGPRAGRAGATLMLAAAIALTAAARGPFAAILSAATLASLACVLAWPGLDQGRRIYWSRLPMLLGSLAVTWNGV